MKQLNEINKTIKKDIIVENLMISNGVYLLVSHPKVGKSMFAQQLAFSLTTGEDFLGFKVNPSHVLYITTEGDINQLETRFKLMNLKPKLDKLHIIDSDDISDFYIRDIEYDIHQLASNNQKLFVIIDMLKDIKFDTSYDLNNYQEINDVVFRKLKELCKKYNITLLVTHHLNKRNETLGSTAFDACIDGKITLFENRNDHNHLTMKVINRDFEGFDIDLKRNKNQTFKISNPIEDDEIDENLILFIKYASYKKDFEFTSTSIIHDAKLKTTALRFGRSLNLNIDLLEKEGLHITKSRTSNERKYHCVYEEPILEDDE